MNTISSQYLQPATIIAGLLSALLYLNLAVNSQAESGADLSVFLATASATAGLCFVLWAAHHFNRQSISVPLLIGFAVVFRVIGLFGYPILEDDMYRYLWDGKMTVEAGSAYLAAPAEFFNDETISLKYQSILANINYPEIGTVYGPMCQWLFALSYLIAPGEVWALQLLLAIVDLILIFVLLRITTPNNVLLYAWCPLIIKEFAFSAHPDVLSALFLTLAVLFFTKRRFAWVGALLACATGAKIFAIIIAPFLLKFNFKGWIAFFLTAVFLSLPFGILQAWLPEGLMAMASDWLFNAPLYFLLAAWLPFGQIKLLLLALFAIGLVIYFVRQSHYPGEIPRGDYVFAALFLVSPALNSWYLVLLLVFATLRPSFWAWAFSFTILLSYVNGKNLHNPDLQSYEIPSSVLVLEFGLVIVVAVLAKLICLVISAKSKKTRDSG